MIGHEDKSEDADTAAITEQRLCQPEKDDRINNQAGQEHKLFVFSAVRDKMDCIFNVHANTGHGNSFEKVRPHIGRWHANVAEKMKNRKT